MKSERKDEVKVSYNKNLLKNKFDKFVDVISKFIECKTGESIMIALKYKIITAILEGEKE